MTALIVFREGHSGNFLKALIDRHSADSIGFRIWESTSSTVHLSHNADLARQQQQGYSPIVRILPTHAVYNAIYNVYAKKILIEQLPQRFQNWHSELDFWYDKCFYNIKEYHQLIRYDIATNCYPNTVDFDRMLNRDYLALVLHQYFDIEFDQSHQQTLDKYQSLQLQISLLDDNQTSMQQISKDISDAQFATDPWFWAYCVYKYEFNNGLQEQQRQWSVNDLTQPGDRASLIELAGCYRTG